MRSQCATLVSAAMLLGVVIAPASDVLAGPSGANSGRSGHGGGHAHHGHAARGHSGTRFVAPFPPRAIPRTVFWAAPVAYAPAPYYAPPPAYNAPPALYYVPPIASNAPLFSFDESPAESEWNWQRVNLQQLVTEVRAKREADRKP